MRLAASSGSRRVEHANGEIEMVEHDHEAMQLALRMLDLPRDLPALID
jgi:hypothetical protein